MSAKPKRSPRFKVLNDGPGRWVMRDDCADDCPVYPSRRQAREAMKIAKREVDQE